MENDVRGTLEPSPVTSARFMGTCPPCLSRLDDDHGDANDDHDERMVRFMKS